MSKPFDKAELPITCEKCRREEKKSIGWIKRNNQLTCRCGTVIRLDSAQFKRDIAKAERELSKFNDLFK